MPEKLGPRNGIDGSRISKCLRRRHPETAKRRATAHRQHLRALAKETRRLYCRQAGRNAKRGEANSRQIE